MADEKKELLEKAKELGIDVEEDAEIDGIKSLIADKEIEVEEEKLKDIEYLRKKLEAEKADKEKAIKRRDTATSERRILQKELADAKEKLEGLPDADEMDTLKEELVTLKKFREEIETAREEEELKSKTEVERVEVRFKKQLENIEVEMAKMKDTSKTELEKVAKELEGRDTQISLLRGDRLKSEILSIAHKFNAINPDQIVRLIRDEFQYDPDLDKFVHLERDQKGTVKDEKSVEEKVKDFLEDPMNDNLVKSDVKSGTGHHSSETHKTEIKTSVDTKGYDLKDPQLKRNADLKGLSLEDYIDTLKIRDAALEKKKT